ncbi:MAG: dynamin family protein [Sulfurimonadaceae bacterium]
MTLQERYDRLKQHLSEENPLLLDITDKYIVLDKVGHKTGLLAPNESYTSHISWWPLISVLGTFSAGKSTFINDYIGQKVQTSGNQAVDDKFTALCYGKSSEPITLPGMALDADPRFPFYNVSEEVDKVQDGEGDRVNQYLQLKTVKTDALKGKILIDSPGFDADSQRDTILRLTSHIIDMSDLVLIFFDARHPEPGAMRDTLDQLVKSAMSHTDADKVLYVLNQIDTTAHEDNLEDVIGAWQRAMAQKGLISGSFYTIFNEKSMAHIDDASVKERLTKKKDADMTRILSRIDKVGTERAYRIVRALQDIARTLKDDKLNSLHEALQKWSRNVFLADMTVVVLLAGALFYLEAQSGLLSASMTVLTVALAGVSLIGLYTHFSLRRLVTNHVAKKWEEKDPDVARAIRHNTRWWKPIIGPTLKSWGKKDKRSLEKLIDQSQMTIQGLNDQFISPSGERASND